MNITVVQSDAHDEWEALYVDGKLKKVGDTYLITEAIYEMVGVRYLDGDFLLGGNSRENCPTNLRDIVRYEEERVEAEDDDT